MNFIIFPYWRLCSRCLAAITLGRGNCSNPERFIMAFLTEISSNKRNGLSIREILPEYSFVYFKFTGLSKFQSHTCRICLESFILAKLSFLKGGDIGSRKNNNNIQAKGNAGVVSQYKSNSTEYICAQSDPFVLARQAHTAAK